MAKRKLATPADLYAAGVDYIAFHRVHNRETRERGYRYLVRGECPESVKSALAWAYSKPGGLQCRPVAGGGYAVARYFDGAHRTQHYTYLLPALRRVTRG